MSSEYAQCVFAIGFIDFAARLLIASAVLKLIGNAIKAWDTRTEESK